MATEKIKMRRGGARAVQHLAGAVLLGDGRMGVYIRTSLILVNVARCTRWLSTIRRPRM